MIVVSDGSKAYSLTKGATEDYASEADQIDPPYVQIKGNVNVRDLPGSYINKEGKKIYYGKKIYTAHNEKLPFEEFDDDTGWWGVMCPAGTGFVSCDIPNYATLVKE